jgi:hypothetical protein
VGYVDRDELKKNLEKLSRAPKLTRNEKELLRDTLSTIRQNEADLRRGGWADHDRSTD